MKKMYILMSHTMTEQQKKDAQETFCVQSFVALPTDVWSQIPAELETVETTLLQLKAQLVKEANADDVLLVQGDYGATYIMVQFAKEIGMVPVYATSKRVVVEKTVGNKVLTNRVFEHVQFRKY